MLKKLGISCKKELLENKGLLQLSWFTTFGHSVSNIFLLLWNLNNVLIYKYHSGVSLLLVFNYFWETITANHMVLWIILLIVFIILGYFILYPIANAGVLQMIVHKGGIGQAVGKGLVDFFSFFEYSALKTSFSIITYAVTVARLFTLDVLDNYFIIAIVGVWGLMVLMSTIFWPFTRIFIAIEGYSVYTAIKKSVGLSLAHFSEVIRAVLYQGILIVYFYFRTGILLAIPTIIMYLVIYFNLFNNGIVSSLLWIM